ncbi:PREDICTED: phospholipase A1-Igamma2, chloroplastic-like isoform X1 [Ipomoea nil]|uniref:phospholipase A1-Igamma2, chloroplastic-like isoform X1 n=2 Tax=Ipomoea nil TaxID=35883 RepID=UPI0009010DA8|nr:PREDICTED: phospholipase A1-Igamma2, chloroplastic-like isoform X1 [Ipomoea nil]
MATITSQIKLWLKKGCTHGILLAKKALPVHRFLEGATGNLKGRFQLVRTLTTTLHGFKKAAEDQKPAERRLADCWEEIHGENNWVGLLEPFDSLLRTELIRYGDMAQACYDAYEEDPSSRFGYKIKIEPHMFFKSLGLTKYGYDVTKYIYSSYNLDVPNFFNKPLLSDDWTEGASWIGYVAVSNDEYSRHLGRRDITIAWRGTVTGLEIFADIQDFQTSTEDHSLPTHDPAIKVEDGFLDVYTKNDESNTFCNKSARTQVAEEVQRLLHEYSGEKLSISVTGHSLGSALATLNAYDIAENMIQNNGEKIPVCVFSFSGPRVGNFRFKSRLEELGVKVLRVANIHDAVPKVPGVLLNERLPVFMQKLVKFLPWSYFHVGEKLMLDHTKSPFIKKSIDIAEVHNLELLLHLLDGYQGEGRPFLRATGRDLALVNKSKDLLNDSLQIPPKWRDALRKKVDNISD